MYFSFMGNGLEEHEKDTMDQQWASIVKNCFSRIQNLSVITHKLNDQLRQHSMGVVWILENKLSRVSTQVTDMQKRRNEFRSVSMYYISLLILGRCNQAVMLTWKTNQTKNLNLVQRSGFY